MSNPVCIRLNRLWSGPEDFYYCSVYDDALRGIRGNEKLCSWHTADNPINLDLSANRESSVKKLMTVCCVCLTGIQPEALASCWSSQSSLSGEAEARTANPRDLTLRLSLSALELNLSCSPCLFCFFKQFSCCYAAKQESNANIPHWQP